MLARLDLGFEAPIKASPSFLLLADNYKPLWKIPAQENHLVALAMKDQLMGLPPTASFSMAWACVLLGPAQASRAAQRLVEHYSKRPL